MYGVRAVLLYECDVQNTRAGSCTCCTTAVRCCTTLYAAVRTVCAVRAVRPALYGTVRPGSQASWKNDTASGVEKSQLRARLDFFQDRGPCRARPLARCSTAGRYPMKGLQKRVWSGRWCPHSNHCSALASLRAAQTADRTVSFRQVGTPRQLVSRARQPGRIKNRRRSFRIRGERRTSNAHQR